MKKRATEKIKFSVARKYIDGDYQTQAGRLHTASVTLCLLVNLSTRQLENSKKISTSSQTSTAEFCCQIRFPRHPPQGNYREGLSIE